MVFAKWLSQKMIKKVPRVGHFFCNSILDMELSHNQFTDMRIVIPFDTDQINATTQH